jgi:phage host-nuclease inhibitor protein Gam
MSKTREKKVVHTGVSVEKMNEAFGRFASADAKLQKINAEMDIQITKIRDKYADEIENLNAAKEDYFDIMQAYALENRDEIFTKKKSLDTAHGTMGFRTGTPALKTRKGFTWAAVTTLLKEYLPAYVRTVEEPAKDKLLADRDNEVVYTLFEKVGIKVEQTETFFVEKKKEE